MSTELILVVGIISVLAAALVGDHYRRQGHNFWKILILGSLAFFGILMLLFKAIEGGQ